MMKLMLALVFLIGAAGCAHAQPTIRPSELGKHPRMQPIIWVELPDSAVQGQALYFSAKIRVPDKGWVFDRFDYRQQSGRTFVTAHAVRTDKPAPALVSILTAGGSHQLLMPGPWQFWFASDDTFLVRTVHVRYP